MVGTTKLHTHLMTVPQVKMTESLPLLKLFTTVVEYKPNEGKVKDWHQTESVAAVGDIWGKR